MRRLLVLVLLLTGCAQPAPTTGRSVQGSSAPCAPASPLPTPPPVPLGLALPAGSTVTEAGPLGDGTGLTGRAVAPVDDVLEHWRTTLVQAGFVLQRDEDEGRSGRLGFFGVRGDGTVTVARLTCPRGQTGYTLLVRPAQ